MGGKKWVSLGSGKKIYKTTLIKPTYLLQNSYFEV